MVQSVIRNFISQDDRSAASIAASTSLSKHVAYKMDYWCALPQQGRPCLSTAVRQSSGYARPAAACGGQLQHACKGLLTQGL